MGKEQRAVSGGGRERYPVRGLARAPRSKPGATL
jgi:hypothetical protein